MRINLPDIGAFERDNEADIFVLNKQNQGAGSLRSAIDLACPSDTIDLSHFEGNIFLDEEIVIDKSISLLGNPDRVFWLRTAAATRHLLIDTSTQVYIKNLSFWGGRPEQAGGGAILNKGNLEIESSTFASNTAISGGAIANYAEGKKSRLKISNCTFSGNQAQVLDGGAIDTYGFTDSAITYINHCTFANNKAEKRGGALFSNSMGFYELGNTILASNAANTGMEVFGNFASEGYNLIEDNSESIFPCLLYTSPSPRDRTRSRMPSSA